MQYDVSNIFIHMGLDYQPQQYHQPAQENSDEEEENPKEEE